MKFELLWIEGGNRITLSWPAFFTKEVLRSPSEWSQVLENILKLTILPLHKNGSCLVCWFYSDSLSGGGYEQCPILPLLTIKLSDYLKIPVHHRWTRSLSSKCNPYNRLIYGHGLEGLKRIKAEVEKWEKEVATHSFHPPLLWYFPQPISLTDQSTTNSHNTRGEKDNFISSRERHEEDCLGSNSRPLILLSSDTVHWIPTSRPPEQQTAKGEIFTSKRRLLLLLNLNQDDYGKGIESCVLY